MARLYLDEDVNILLVSLLRARNIDATSALEKNMLGKSDQEQLKFASTSAQYIPSGYRKSLMG